MLYLGIDPGEKGSATVVGLDGRLIRTPNGSYRHLEFAKATEHEMANWFRELAGTSRSGEFIRAGLEKVRAMPGQGGVSMFTFGWNYGLVRGILVALRIPFVEPTPQVWQRGLGIPVVSGEAKTDRKRRLKAFAQERFPEWSAKITNDRADSPLIADWLRLQEVKSK